MSRKPYRTEIGEFWTWHVPRVGRLTMSINEMVRQDGKTQLNYSFIPRGRRNPLFEGSDFACPAHRPVDSLQCALSLLNFLCLRPGDTDSEYFDNYTDAQREWSESYECECAQAELSDLQEQMDGGGKS